MNRTEITQALDHMGELLGTQLLLDELAGYLSTDTLTDALQYISTNWCLDVFEDEDEDEEDEDEEDEDEPLFKEDEDEDEELFIDEDYED